MTKGPLTLEPMMTKKGLKKYARMIAKMNGYAIEEKRRSSSKHLSPSKRLPPVKSIAIKRRELARDLALMLVAKKRGHRVSDTQIDLFMKWYEFQREFEHAYPSAGHATIHNNATAVRRACRCHAASLEWPHIRFKSGRPKNPSP
jgi:hypothetical protein